MAAQGSNHGCRAIIAWLVALPLAFLLLPMNLQAQSDDTWLLVDTQALTLTVMQGEATLQEYENIAIGSNGATLNKQSGDEKTPLGEFRINEIRDSERFVQFISIDYPNLQHADRALQAGRISSAVHRKLRQAQGSGVSPPQHTVLGGNLGIHGLGKGSPEVHNTMNWTNGCIALTNEQLAELVQQITIGTRVSIR